MIKETIFHTSILGDGGYSTKQNKDYNLTEWNLERACMMQNYRMRLKAANYSKRV